MKYYSTNKQAPMASIQEAVVKGLADDRGLFMPMTIKPLPQEFYDTIDTLSFQEIAYRVADAFFGEDIPADVSPYGFFYVPDTLSPHGEETFPQCGIRHLTASGKFLSAGRM